MNGTNNNTNDDGLFARPTYDGRVMILHDGGSVVISDRFGPGARFITRNPAGALEAFFAGLAAVFRG